MEKTNSFSLTKKIAKHGNQSIIVIPRILEKKLKPKTIVQLKIDIIEEVEEIEEENRNKVSDPSKTSLEEN
ncbi:hypothetical protein K9L67_01665 [Candidatus Woesearchaeota archaeon]|nr:hypothetical protein [Candidatus Woesearchaeota archaeon]MCF7900911.1 hypothetical protein [Candidatus Woesearchaeota archaeon]MCF8013040.1 hypothetical protein [Candidatus Woesearchaeota archaeon]